MQRKCRGPANKNNKDHSNPKKNSTPEKKLRKHTSTKRHYKTNRKIMAQEQGKSRQVIRKLFQSRQNQL